MAERLKESHVERYNQELELLSSIEEKLDPAYLGELKVDKLKQLLHEQVVPRLLEIRHPVVAEYIFGMAITYPHTYVRYTLVDVVKHWLPYHSAVETIVKLTQDPDDLVTFKALDVVAEEKIEQTLRFLPRLIGKASDRIYFPKKPVGLGAAKALKTAVALLGTDDPQQLQDMEEYYNRYGKLADRLDYVEEIPLELIAEFEQQQEPGMIFIPGGFFTFGLNAEEVPDKTFGWLDSCPARKVWLPPFFIDKYPVTNEEYDEFVEDVKKNGHRFCHPSEPEGKDHTRNTFWDSRFKPHHPVTGIDFYDAYAYARWAGKELPTEYQWEKAARGTDGRIWPWGNEFKKDACNWAYQWSGKEPQNLEEWRSEILKVNEDYPNVLVRDAKEYDQKEYVSPYGVVSMVGNTWEWTRSDFATGRAFMPSLSDDKSPWNQYAVLKGGSFISIPGLMFPSFRTKDIPFCRHNEMGIRCVKNIPIHVLRKAIGKPITNTAIY